MFHLSDSLRFWIWIFVGISTIGIATLYLVFEEDVKSWILNLRKKSKPQIKTKLPPIGVRILLVIFTIVAIWGTAVASTAPSDDLPISQSDIPLLPPPPPDTMRVILTDFGASEENLLFASLRNEAKNNKKIDLQSIHVTITEADANKAIELGFANSANIVVWGYYITDQSVITKDVPLVIHFEILDILGADEPMLSSCKQTTNQIRMFPSERIHDLTLQTGTELTYATIFAIGLSQYTSGDFDGAVMSFTKALEQITPETTLAAETAGSGLLIDQSVIFYFRGDAYFRLNRYLEARNDYEKILDIISRDPTGLFNLGRTYKELGDFDRSIKYFDRVIAIGNAEQKAIALFEKGWVYIREEDYDAANDSFNLALSTDSSSVAQYVVNAGLEPIDLDRLISELEVSLPNNALPHYLRGKANIETNPEYALSEINKALEIYPDIESAYETKAIYYFERENFAEAAVNFDKLLGNPNWTDEASNNTPCLKSVLADYFVGRGHSLAQIRETSKGQDDYEKALEMLNAVIIENPNYGYPHYVRGKVYYFQGHNWLAYKELIKAKKLGLSDEQNEDANEGLNVMITPVVTGILILGSVALIALLMRRDLERSKKSRRR